MRKTSDAKEATHTFYSGEFEILPGTDLDDVLLRMRETISERLSKMEAAVGSGWVHLKIVNVKLHFATFKPLRGSSYVDLPSWIKNKKAVVNIMNRFDNECFKWCVTRALHPIGEHPERLTKKLREQSKLFDWTGVSFPTSFEDIALFEKNNNISVRILGCDEETKEIVCLRNGNGRYKLAVTLLLFEDHYCVVKNMSRLTSRQLTDDNAAFFCDYCSFTHRKKDAVLRHQELCTGEVLEPVRVMPKEGSVVKFKNYERTVEQPFVVYADFESRLRPTCEKKGSSTTQFHEHTPIGYAYQLVSRVDPADNKLVQYTATTEDEDVALHFIRSLQQTTTELHEKCGVSKPMEISAEQQTEFDGATKCCVCGDPFEDREDANRRTRDKVRDHCHFTGKYRGAAHNKCNLRLARSKRIPILFHNFTNYDNHLFVKALGKIEGDIHVIARNDEKHISVTKDVPLGNEKWQLRFSDTMSFVLGSLSTHVDNLRNVGFEKFKISRAHFQDDEKFKSVVRKGVFPYEWLTSVSSLAETKLPGKSAFFSHLNLAGISDEDYDHAK